MILLIDNYDSFAYNVYQLIGSMRADIKVIRNDECSIKEIEEMQPEAIIISPGPGKPSEAGICIELIKEFSGRIPILGICLGHQAICEAFGATVSYAKELMHGKQKNVTRMNNGVMFRGMADEFPVARYHSLAVKEETIPEELKITARCEDGEIMAVEHVKYPVFGLQFHPESILTPNGRLMIYNFFTVVDSMHKKYGVTDEEIARFSGEG